ncbi:MAG TPA: PQQ-binding-like beta-propeller repeat protein, partial [Candidatus Thermoplasmatota archaeon]|nr:PQQ-binding-like beta-propeller repeat protein [Candidatus Thermoplasmatota archaeon]
MAVRSTKHWLGIWVVYLLVCVLVLPVIAGPQIQKNSRCSNGSSPSILWHHDLLAPSFGSAAVGDIDGDGKQEIVFGTYFHDEHIYALNAEDGSILWTYDTGGCNDASVAIADVDQDGAL